MTLYEFYPWIFPIIISVLSFFIFQAKKENENSGGIYGGLANSFANAVLLLLIIALNLFVWLIFFIYLYLSNDKPL